MKYIALLRGINVGGNKKVPMAELRKRMEQMGYKNVKTLLNSGNVIFEAANTKEKLLITKLKEGLKKTFGFEVQIMIRSMENIQELISMDPFHNIEINKDVRLYVSFLPEESESKLELPYNTLDRDFQVMHRTAREVFSVLNVNNARSVDAMAFLEKEYGKNITTRNWNTIVKIAAK